MSSRKPSDVVLVEVPFTDLSQSKKRPALVLLSRDSDHLVAFLTSRIEQAGPDGVVVSASAKNGLAVDSAVLVTKLFTLPRIPDRQVSRAAEQIRPPGYY